MTEAIIRVNKQGRVVHLEGRRIVLEQPKDIFRRLRSTFNSSTSLVDECQDHACSNT